MKRHDLSSFGHTMPKKGRKNPFGTDHLRLYVFLRYTIKEYEVNQNANSDLR